MKHPPQTHSLSRPAPLVVSLGAVVLATVLLPCRSRAEDPRSASARTPGATVVLTRPDATASPAPPAAIGASPAAAHPTAPATADAEDPYRWLEQVDSEPALAWVRQQNAATAAKLESQPLYHQLYGQALAVLNAASRLPHVTERGKWLYNLWKDEAHPRGVYRRTTLPELRQKDPAWQVVLDIDALAAKEHKPWVFKNMDCLEPLYRRCLVSLSPGGGDAVEVREMDGETFAFVPRGFFLPLAKSSIHWRDDDTVFVGTDFGPGSLTDSGYPRIVKLWKRGTPLAEARTLYEAGKTSVSASGSRLRSSGGDVDLVTDGRTFWTTKVYQLVGNELAALDLPESAEVSDIFAGKLLISLKDDWKRGERTFPADSVLLADPSALRGGAGTVEALVTPTGNEVVETVAAAKSGVLVTMLDSVRGRLYRYERGTSGWTRRAIPFPDNGALGITSVEATSGDAFVQFESFVTPPTLYHVPDASPMPEQIKQQEATFDGSRFEVTQHWAASADGTKVPYFEVAPKGLKLDGNNPTHVFSYGGFRNALTPSYSGSYEQLAGAYGKLWLERGGVFVLANIRGGGEFGEAWHKAALNANRPRAYDDFEAVAQDLVARRVTSPAHLGIEGRSNGGLLVLATMVRRPDLYGAVVCGSPLADMRRYHELLAGASWVAEYGNPDKPEAWGWLRAYSPYQNVKPGVGYPPIFFYLSTRDDRVHPGHARKMAARMESFGDDVLYFELVEGGHGASVTNEQLAHRLALAYTHLWNHLGRGAAASP